MGYEDAENLRFLAPLLGEKSVNTAVTFTFLISPHTKSRHRLTLEFSETASGSHHALARKRFGLWIFVVCIFVSGALRFEVR